MSNKRKNVISRRQSTNNNRLFNLGKNKEINSNYERKDSNISSVSNTSFMSINNYFNTKLNNEKISKNLNNVNLRATFSKNQKTIDIPLINFQRINQRRNTNISNLSIYENKPTLKITNKFFSSKNNILNINEKNRSKTIKQSILNAKIQTNNNNYSKSDKNNLTVFIKPQSSHESNNSFSEELLYDSKSPREYSKNNYSNNGKKKSESYSYPYTSKNEFINFAFNKFRKKNDQNEEKYIKNYLNKVKGYDNAKTETFVNNIYERNLKNNIKDLKKHITDNDIYSKTERLYLNSHLINRIKPLLISMGERDKMIYRLEKNLTNAISNK